MFQFKLKDGSYKKWKVKKVTAKTTPNGTDLTEFSLCNKLGENKFEWARFTCWEKLPIVDNDEIEIIDVIGYTPLKVKKDDKEYDYTSLTVKVKVVSSSQPVSNPTIMTELPEINSDTLPF